QRFPAILRIRLDRRDPYGWCEGGGHARSRADRHRDGQALRAPRRARSLQGAGRRWPLPVEGRHVGGGPHPAGPGRQGRSADGMTTALTIEASPEELAARWLEAEARVEIEPANQALAQEAVRLASAYEAAIRVASLEELRLAWEAARRRQAQEE